MTQPITGRTVGVERVPRLESEHADAAEAMDRLPSFPRDLDIDGHD